MGHVIYFAIGPNYWSWAHLCKAHWFKYNIKDNLGVEDYEKYKILLKMSAYKDFYNDTVKNRFKTPKALLSLVVKLIHKSCEYEESFFKQVAWSSELKAIAAVWYGVLFHRWQIV